MTSFLSKRFAIFISLVLTVGIFTPSALKLAHVFNGHGKEKQCIAQGTNHIHDIDFDCDFQDFTLTSKVLYTSHLDYSLMELVVYEHLKTSYSPFFNSYQKEHRYLRGPPSVSS